MKSYQKPIDDQINAVIPLLSSPRHKVYFFSNLENPQWIIPLAQRNMFAYPPKAEYVEGGGVRSPSWPESKYLARMAEHAPVEVAEIFAGLETDNASINCDTVDAAMAMPVEIAVTLVPSICRAAENNALWFSFKEASDLCIRLAEGDKVPEAMQLSEALFTPRSAEDRKKFSQMDEHWYKKGLEKVVPVLAKLAAEEFLPKLCEWLKTTIEDEKHVDPGDNNDNSYIWRPAIEEHEQNGTHDFPGVMVGYVRDGFEEVTRAKQLTLNEALDILNDYSYLVFQRLRLHLINQFADQDAELAKLIMMDHEFFEDHKFKHEYAMLVGNRWGMLAPDEQAKWLGWIDGGPDKKWIERNSTCETTEEDRKRWTEYWQFQKLHWIRAHLEGDKREFYDRMFAEHGKPELADLNISSGSGWVGHDSPMTVEELAGMTFEDVVEKIASWRRPEGSRYMGPSSKGLASTFQEYIDTNPEEFSKKASVLFGQPSIYVRTFINQMSKGIADGKEIDLDAVIGLCKWVVSRPADERTTPEEESYGLVDKDWQWTRDDISRLIEIVCDAKKGESPKYSLEPYRQKLRELIEHLCHDRAKSYVVHDVTKDDPRTRDYLNIGINSPRGKAMRAALEYARWVAKHKQISDGDQEIVPEGFKAMPEVRKMIEWQIAAENRSVEALSVIGSRMGLLYGIDKKWLKDNTELIFQLNGLEEKGEPPNTHGWAAWNAFLVWVSPHIAFYGLFTSQFAYAVEQSGKVELTESSREQPMNRLGEHLMTLYGRGQLGLDDDGLLKKFIDSANPSIRRHAIGFVGQNLKGDEKLPDDVIQRFMDLWEYYWTELGKKDAEGKPEDWLFGTWFSCGQFEDKWALDQLEQFGEVVPSPQPSHAVAERLAEIINHDTITSADIAKAVRILDRAIRESKESWHVHDWLEPAKTILQKAMKEAGEAKEKAIALIDDLGRCGYDSFGELLKNSS